MTASNPSTYDPQPLASAGSGVEDPGGDASGWPTGDDRQRSDDATRAEQGESCARPGSWAPLPLVPPSRLRPNEAGPLGRPSGANERRPGTWGLHPQSSPRAEARAPRPGAAAGRPSGGLGAEPPGDSDEAIVSGTAGCQCCSHPSLHRHGSEAGRGPWVSTPGSNSTGNPEDGQGCGRASYLLPWYGAQRTVAGDEEPLYDLPPDLPGSPEPLDVRTLDLEELHPDGGLRQLRLEVAAALGAAGQGKAAERLRACGDQTVVYACQAAHPRAVPVRCRHRLCPECQRTLAAEAAADVRRCLDAARVQGLRVAHLVLTAPTVPEVTGEVLGTVHRAVGRLWRTVGLGLEGEVRQDGSQTGARLAGLYRSTEAAPAEGGGWHVHVHCLVALAPGFMDYGELGRDLALRWHGLTGCERDCPVKVASLEGGGKGCTAGGSAWLGDVLNLRDDRPERRRAVEDLAAEVAKYVVKGLSLVDDEGEVSPEVVGPLAAAIAHRRLRQGYGGFTGLGPAGPGEGASCRICEAHNAAVGTWDAGGRQGEPPPPGAPGLPQGEYVEAGLRWEGTPQRLERLAGRGDPRAARILWRLYAEHPELWGEDGRAPPAAGVDACGGRLVTGLPPESALSDGP